MGSYMKTTIDISDPLFTKAKALAQRENTTFRSLVEQGLQLIIRERTEKKTKPFRLKKASVKGSGLAPDAIGSGGMSALREIANERDYEYAFNRK